MLFTTMDDGIAAAAYATRPTNEAVDCVGAFGDYTDCSKGCGGGQKSRTFHVTTPAEHGGAQCEHKDGYIETTECNTEPCTHIGLKRVVWENLHNRASEWRNKYSRLVHVLPDALPEGTAPSKPDLAP